MHVVHELFAHPAPVAALTHLIEQVGSYAGFAAVIGLAVLSALYFSQARDVKRLRDWAGRAPERATEFEVGGRTPEAAAVRTGQQVSSGAVGPAQPISQPTLPGVQPGPRRPRRPLRPLRPRDRADRRFRGRARLPQPRTRAPLRRPGSGRRPLRGQPRARLPPPAARLPPPIARHLRPPLRRSLLHRRRPRPVRPALPRPPERRRPGQLLRRGRRRRHRTGPEPQQPRPRGPTPAPRSYRPARYRSARAP